MTTYNVTLYIKCKIETVVTADTPESAVKEAIRREEVNPKAVEEWYTRPYPFQPEDKES